MIITLRRLPLLAPCVLTVLAGCVTRGTLTPLPALSIEVLPPAITFPILVIAPPVHASIAPPPLPLYAQPPCPEEGYQWIPGYWHYGPMGYYWVPGTWVEPPQTGLLWTPGYWDFVAGIYAFNAGYWSSHVGFYGGVNYGYGYSGSGFDGGQWVNGAFSYNTAVTHVNATVVHNTYTQAEVTHVKLSRVSYNGGPGGTRAKATVQERAAAQEPHFTPNLEQRQHAEAAAHNSALAVQRNGGHPGAAVIAAVRPLAPTESAHLPGLVPPRVTAKPATVPHKLAVAAARPLTKVKSREDGAGDQW